MSIYWHAEAGYETARESLRSSKEFNRKELFRLLIKKLSGKTVTISSENGDSFNFYFDPELENMAWISREYADGYKDEPRQARLVCGPHNNFQAEAEMIDSLRGSGSRLDESALPDEPTLYLVLVSRLDWAEDRRDIFEKMLFDIINEDLSQKDGNEALNIVIRILEDGIMRAFPAEKPVPKDSFYLVCASMRGLYSAKGLEQKGPYGFIASDEHNHGSTTFRNITGCEATKFDCEGRLYVVE